MNPHNNPITWLGGGSRKMGLYVLLTVLGAIGVFIGRLTWPEFLASSTALAAIVALATGLEDAAAKWSAPATPAAPATPTPPAESSTPAPTPPVAGAPGDGP